MDKLKNFFKNPTTINVLIIVVISILFFGIPIIKNGILYDMNDDLAMKAIASGVYMDEPSLNLIFSGFPFSFGLVALYILFPKIDWYGTILLLSVFFFTITTIYYITKNLKKTYEKNVTILILFCLFAFLLPKICTFLTFTKVAGFIISCCLILYLLPDNTLVKKIIIGLGIILSYGIRDKACFMILIFFAPALLYKTWKDKEAFKKDVIFGAIVVCALIACMFVEKVIIYHDSAWKDYFEYNLARSEYYDYYLTEMSKLPREEQIEIYFDAGLNGDQIFMLENYAIGLDTSIPDKIPNIIKACEAHNVHPSSSMLTSINTLIFNNEYGRIYLFSVLILICFSIEDKNRKENIIKFVPFFLLQILILLYLAHDGRIVERVYTPLYFGFVSMNLIMLLNMNKAKELYNTTINSCKTLVICLVIAYLITYTTQTHITKAGTAFYKSKEWMSDYFQAHQENFYLFNRDNSEYYYLFNKYTFNNYINYGGWSAYSPIHTQKIKNRNADSLAELVFRDNVYFITNDQTDINLYRFLDENMTIEYIDKVNEYMIYKFRK